MAEEVAHDGDGDREELPGPRALRIVEAFFRDIAGILILMLCALVVISVAARFLPSIEIPDHHVFAGELMVTLVALPWAFVTADRGHISVEIFTNWVSSGARIVLDILAAIIALVMILPIAWAVGAMAYDAWSFGNYFDGVLYLPEWPGRFTFFLGFLLMLVRLAALLVIDVRLLLRGQRLKDRRHDEFF